MPDSRGASTLTTEPSPLPLSGYVTLRQAYALALPPKSTPG